MKGSGYPSENILKIVANGKFVKGIPRSFPNGVPISPFPGKENPPAIFQRGGGILILFANRLNF
jgi:hypothetical protein